MKKLLLIGPKNLSPTTKNLMKEAEKRFKVDYVPVNQIVLRLTEDKAQMFFGKKDLTKYDYCLPRIDSKRVQHGYHVIRFMDMIGMAKPYSAESILIAHNKYMTLETMRKADVPIPDTCLIESPSAAQRVLKKMKYPIVVKLVSSFGGEGVMIFDDAKSAVTAINTMKAMKQQIIIEEFVKNPGEDIRAFVVGREIVTTMKRVAKKGEARANIHLGGKGKHFILTGEMKDVALRAAAASGSDIVAVDMIEGEDGPKVIEINLNPGISGLQKATNVNVAEAIIKFVEEKVNG
jgi:ribosomal protein S6--L-glutamate ligase